MTGGFFIAAPIPIFGLFTPIILVLKDLKSNGLIKEKDIKKIKEKLSLKKRMKDNLCSDIQKKLPNIIQELRTSIEKAVDKKMEFIQMLLAAQKNYE